MFYFCVQLITLHELYHLPCLLLGSLDRHSRQCLFSILILQIDFVWQLNVSTGVEIGNKIYFLPLL
jgi:hypothetical protein